jgi:hypothetical protein
MPKFSSFDEAWDYLWTHKSLPADFDQWELSAGPHMNIARVAATHGFLPAGFGRWGVATSDGWTAAHEAASYGHLPKDFTQWGQATLHGFTVAHVAAMNGTLPDDFDQWDLGLETYGRSVAHSRLLKKFLEIILTEMLVS